MYVDLHNPLLPKYGLNFAKRLSATSPPRKTMASTSLLFISVMLSLGEYCINEIIQYVIIKIALYHSV